MPRAPRQQSTTSNHLAKSALKGEFQRANITRTKLLGLSKGKLLIIQVVWVIEASPEKAGVGGSTPSLATI
jgi:hypothetical protein